MVVFKWVNSGFFWGMFVINIFGSFIMGFVVEYWVLKLGLL